MFSSPSDSRRCARSRPIRKSAAREFTGKSYRGVGSFNDDATTTHSLVLAVLNRSRDNILSGRVSVTNRPTVEATVDARVRRFSAALARIG